MDSKRGTGDRIWFAPLGYILIEFIAIGLIASLVLAWPGEVETAAPSRPHEVVAVGDMTCGTYDWAFHDGHGEPGHCQMQAVADLVRRLHPEAVLAVGDLQYDNGEFSQFESSYDRFWGNLKPITLPVPGNHEYAQTGASGYFDYFDGVGKDHGQGGDRGKGYYSENIGTWHIVVLNSNCNVVGCSEASAQGAWLRQDLVAKLNQRCVLALWHHPHFTSGQEESDVASQAMSTVFWKELRAAGADVVVNGHDHVYERFDKQDANGKADPHGIRQFTVGTGGKDLFPLSPTPMANSQYLNDETFGALKLSLYDNSYAWEFIDVSGKVLDHGSAGCNSPVQK